jgi:hypothetical protein
VFAVDINLYVDLPYTREIIKSCKEADLFNTVSLSLHVLMIMIGLYRATSFTLRPNELLSLLMMRYKQRRRWSSLSLGFLLIYGPLLVGSASALVTFICVLFCAAP